MLMKNESNLAEIAPQGAHGLHTTHYEYDKYLKSWQFMRDMIDGLNVQDKYVQDIMYVDPNCPLGDPLRKRARYMNKLYREGAIYMNFVAKTKSTIVGIATNTKYDIKFPPEMEYLLETATANGLGFHQLERSSLNEQFELGRIGFMVDMPQVKAVQQGRRPTMPEQAQPRIHIYKAESIYNWKHEVRNGRNVLTEVRLIEHKTVMLSRFEAEVQEQVRLLSLDENGFYQVEVFDKDDRLIEGPIPIFKAGKRATKIEFYFAGIEDNDPSVDNSPLIGVANLNKGHLRANAILMDNLRRYGRGTIGVTSSHKMSDWDKMLKGRPLEMGDGYFLGDRGAITLTQLAPATAAVDAMNMYVEQALMIGASIITNASSNAPVETTRLNMTDKVSVLENAVDNCESCMNELLDSCAEFLGLDPLKLRDSGDLDYKMSREFVSEATDPQTLIEMRNAIVAEILPAVIYRNYCRDTGLFEMTEEEIQTALQQQDPIVGMLTNDKPEADDASF